MNRFSLFDGANLGTFTKGGDLSNWTRDDFFTVFGNYYGADDPSARTLYAAVAWLFACVNLRADRISSLPWALYQGERRLITNEDDLSAYGFLDNFSELLDLTEMSLCLLGYAYWFKQRNARNAPLGLRWFAPETMQPLYDPTVGIAGFRRYQSATPAAFAPSESASRTYSPDDIVYFKLPNPFSEVEPGSPPAQAALADAQVLHNMNDFAASFFSRGAIKATVLQVDPAIKDAEMQKIEAWWKRFFSGIRKAWSTAAIRANTLNAVVVGEGMESLANNALTTEKRQSIATALGVPHSIIAADAANFATAEQDNINFISNCIIPESKLLERSLNRQLFSPAGLRLKFEAERLLAMQDDKAQRAQSYSLYVNAKMPPSIAAQVAGIELPEGVTYDDLDAELELQQQLQEARLEGHRQAQIENQDKPQAMLPGPTEPPQDAQPGKISPFFSAPPGGKKGEQKSAEIRKLQRWAKGKKTPDVDRFQSSILSREEKLAALQGAAVVESAPFPYP
jgi:HK97 family phage portal protein